MDVSFRIGDKAVYPAHGVAEVTGIETKEIGGKKLSFYILRILENGMRIMVPIKNVGRGRPALRVQQERGQRGLRHPEDARSLGRRADVEPSLPRVHGEDQDGLASSRSPRFCAICRC